MIQLRIYQTAGVIYFEYYNTSTLVVTSIANTPAGTVNGSIINLPNPTPDKLRFVYAFSGALIVEYQFDMITDAAGTPYSLSTAQEALDAIALVIDLSTGTGGGGGDATAANQVLQTDELVKINAATGAPENTPATSDTDNVGLIALFKRYLQRFTLFITAFGGAGGGAATSDTANTGLISLFKRLLVGGVRIKNTAGTQTIEFGQQLAVNSLPVVLSSDNNAVTTTPNATGQLLAHSRVSTASTNATLVKTGSTKVVTVTVSNMTAGLLGGAVRYLKLYNKATAPVAGVDVPVWREAIQIGTTLTFTIPEGGILFNLGLGYTVVTGIADNSNGAIGANEIYINIAYK